MTTNDQEGKKKMDTNSAAAGAFAAGGIPEGFRASFNALSFAGGRETHLLTNERTGESMSLHRGQLRDLLKLLHLASGAD